jgi:cytoskeletal protein CcmA (bactofilin family)
MQLPQGSSRRASAWRFTAAGTKKPWFSAGLRLEGAGHVGGNRSGNGKAGEGVRRCSNGNRVRTENRHLDRAKTRINGDVEFVRRLHFDGYINGNVKGQRPRGDLFVGERAGLHRGLGDRAQYRAERHRQGRHRGQRAGRTGPKARVLGNVHYSTIETAVGAQINGKLIHRANPPGGRKVMSSVPKERGPSPEL